MANPFLNTTPRDVETALLLERAIVHDIDNITACTNGNDIFLNTDDNLFDLLPAYDPILMKKWLLWHEEMHLQLKHHNRFFKYLDELSAEDTKDKFQVTKDEVNIIMDILVHDWMSNKFPELVEIAMTNFAQFRNRNSLKYTFKTFTLEEMLDEYKTHKKDDDSKDGDDDKDGKDGEDGDTSDDTKDGKGGSPSDDDTKDGKKGDSPSEDTEDKDKDDKESEQPKDPGEGEHDKTDWSQDKTDHKEFLTERESDEIKRAVSELKRKKLKLAKLTETLNGLVTSTRKRSYSMPSTIHTGGSVLLKGSTPGKAQLYLIFDASGSMGREIDTFKEIISKTIPQAMNTPCEWFAGDQYDVEPKERVKPYKKVGCDGYYKALFKNFMSVDANGGYNDDGDRTIELCWQAEQQGYSPIGITDGGGQISWSKDKLKQLKRTVLVGHKASWLEKAKAINPAIQILSI